MKVPARIVPQGQYCGEVIHDSSTLLQTATALMREAYPAGSRLIAFTLRVSELATIPLLISAQQGAHYDGFRVELGYHHDGFVVLNYWRRGW